MVLRKDLVASELGATPAADPKARYLRLTCARWSLLELAEAAGGSVAVLAVDMVSFVLGGIALEVPMRYG